MENLSCKENCQLCKECCKFEADESYFAPLFTKEEIKNIEKQNGKTDFFKNYKNSDNVFQIKLVKADNNKYVCPFLDGDSHLCKVYSMRPFDCRIWPFIFMKDKKGRSVLACFDKEICSNLKNMKQEEFDKLKENFISWLYASDSLSIVLKNKELIWDYEEDTFIIEEIEKIKD